MNFESPELDDAWHRTRWNQAEVAISKVCVCLGCETYFMPSRVKWRAPKQHSEEMLSATPLGEMTALCPNCGQELVLGDSSGYPIQNPDFVRALADYAVRMKYV